MERNPHDPPLHQIQQIKRLVEELHDEVGELRGSLRNILETLDNVDPVHGQDGSGTTLESADEIRDFASAIGGGVGEGFPGASVAQGGGPGVPLDGASFGETYRPSGVDLGPSISSTFVTGGPPGFPPAQNAGAPWGSMVPSHEQLQGQHYQDESSDEEEGTDSV